MGSSQYWAGRVYGLCLYFMTGATKGSTESGFMGKPINRTCDPWFTRQLVIHVNDFVLRLYF